MTHDELLALMEVDHPDWCDWLNDNCNCPYSAVIAVVELCATLDEVTIGDKGLFNSGRNSMREEIKQAIERELK